MRLTRSEHAAGWMFVLPAALLIIGFGLFPIGWALLLSFQSSDFVSPAKWVGLANYQALQSDPEFRSAIVRTLAYTALFVPVSVLGGLAMAVVLNAKVRFISIYRTAVFIPVACSTVATAIIFNWLLEPTFGVVNYVLGWVGLGPYGFFQNPDQALGSVVLMTSWGWIGFNAIVYLAALQSISQELIEAASIDGAGRFGASSGRCSARRPCSSLCGRRSTHCRCSTRSTSPPAAARSTPRPSSSTTCSNRPSSSSPRATAPRLHTSSSWRSSR
jgi:multiple sugar transport system permease protein